jgi:hypothetical protein
VKFALNGKPNIRAPRGSTKHERLPENAKVEKYNIESRSAAEIMSYIEAKADQVLYFLVRDAHGQLQRLPFMVRWVYHEADIEEQIKVNGLKGKVCIQCKGAETAMKGKGNGPGTSNRPYMKLDNRCCCDSAERRTPMNVLAEQARLANMRRQGASAKEYHEACKESRVRPFVFNSQIALVNILPHSCGGPYRLCGLDILHGVQKGPCGTLVTASVILMRKHKTETSEFSTYEDVHARQDMLLGLFKAHYQHINFNIGFWGSGKIGGLKGDEQLALCRLLPFTFLGSRQMISCPKCGQNYWVSTGILCFLSTSSTRSSVTQKKIWSP